MSKYMQLTVTVRPFYEREMKIAYPKLVRYLRQADSALLDRDPSLYELAGQLDSLLYISDGTSLREVLLRHGDSLRNTHKKVQENIADRNLGQADKLLYILEDIFDEIEYDLE
jgi:hypothetical protein